jgi:predicted nuclease with TOPRIM domain
VAYCIPCNTEDVTFPHTCAIGPIQKKLDDAIWAKEAAEGCNAATQFLLDEAKRERDEWETSSTNWQADCRVAQTRLAAVELERDELKLVVIGWKSTAEQLNERVAELEKELEAALNITKQGDTV